MSLKQQVAIKKISDNLREGITKPLGSVMLEAGYSIHSARHPDILTRSKLWRKTFEEAFPDKVLVKVGQEGLKATKLHGTDNDFVEIPDHSVRHKFWRDIIGLKGYASQGATSNTQINISYDNIGGYIPPDNILGIPPTSFKKQDKTIEAKPLDDKAPKDQQIRP